MFSLFKLFFLLLLLCHLEMKIKLSFIQFVRNYLFLQNFNLLKYFRVKYLIHLKSLRFKR
jgi:hypothetical protein